MRSAPSPATRRVASALLASVALAWVPFLASCPERSAAPPAAAKPLIVDAVPVDSAAQRSGLLPGDQILAWRRRTPPPATSEAVGDQIRTPFDLLALEPEQVPRGEVTLSGRRGGEPRQWTMAAGRWELATRPELPPTGLELLRRGEEALAGGRTADLVAAWATGADQALEAAEPWVAAWWHYRLGQSLRSPADGKEAKAHFAEAVRLADPLGDAALTALLLRAHANHLDDLGEVPEAEAALRRAFELEAGLDPPPLSRAQTLSLHAAVVGQRERYGEARALLGRAQEILEKEAPTSLPLAEVLNRLGIVAYRSEQLGLAEDRLSRADQLFERLDRGSRGHALAVSNLGVVANLRGDYAAAEAFYRRALEMAERRAPGGREVLGPLGNVGTTLIERGDLAGAEALYRRALEISERTEVENIGRSIILVNLGNIAQNRGDEASAERYFRDAIRIQERQVPDGQLLTQTLSNLGTVLMGRRDFAGARRLFHRVLDVEAKAGRSESGTSSALANLGQLELASDGNLERAESYLRRALEQLSRWSREGIHHSDVLLYQAELATRRQQHEAAAALAKQALAMRSHLAQGSLKEAEALNTLGRAELALGRREASTEHLCAAVSVLDQQRRQLGGGEGSRLWFESAVSRYYQDCLEARLREDRPAAAFEVSERRRARAFLWLLAERDLRFAELPPELLARRNRLDHDYDRVSARLAELFPEQTGEDLARWLAEQAKLRQQREALVAELRQTSARSADLEHPEPLDLAQSRAALDPGTFLLSYSVGTRSTRLFIVAPPEFPGPGLEVLELPVGERLLRRKIELYRQQLAAPLGSGRRAGETTARQLYGLLLQPAEGALTSAARLLVVPDGPLHSLPFVALPWAAPVQSGARGLAGKPIHLAVSATVYAELKRRRPATPRAVTRLVAFGDPRYRPLAEGAASGAAVLPRRRRLGPLPATRREVEAIAALFPGARVFLGEEAREETVAREGPGAEILHFACHGWADEREPLNSALALSEPAAEGRENGLLQVWEIFERLRLSADLVTLSACDTALGKDMGGEGLVGLTRAFQFAGARSVVASLWQVSDASTGELMRSFYAHLRQGVSKDQALAAAQRELATSTDPQLAHPRQWAAFQLYGDWM